VKLPQYVAEAPVPSKTGLGEYQALPANFGQAIPQALAQVGRQAQQTAASVGEEFMLADRRRRQLEEANQAATLTTEAELLLKQRSFDISQGQDYHAYDQQFRDGAKEITAQVLAKTTNPNVKAAVQLRLTKRTGEELLDLQVAKLKKYQDVQVAAMDQNLLNAENLVGLSSKPEEIANYTGLALGNIEAMAQAGLITQVEAVKRKTKFLEGISAVKARQDIDRDPEAFIANADRYINLDPTKRQSLVEHATKLVEFNANKADRVQRQQERDEAKALKAQQSQNSIELTQRLRTGKADAGTVMDWASRRLIDENDQRFMLGWLDTRARSADAAADRAQRQREHGEEVQIRNVDAALGILATTGQLGREGILAYARDKNLPARAIDGALSKAEARDKATASEWNRQHTQAEQMLRSGLNIPSLIPENFDPSRLNAYAGALDELTLRSKAYGGQDDPIAVGRELVQKYRDVLTGETHTKMDALQGLLRYPTPDALEANKASLPPSIYQEQQRLFKQLYDLSKTLTTGPTPPAKATPGMLRNMWEWWQTPGRAAPGEAK